MSSLKYILISLFLISNSAFAQLSKTERQQLFAEYDVFYNEQMELAIKGEPKAQYAVSLMLAISLGNMRSDADKSIEWATKSEEQGNIDAKRLLAAHIHLNSSEHALMKAASTGELKNPARHILRKYIIIDPQKQRESLIKNFKNALKTADMGYPKSHLQLVEMYYEGQGTERNIVKAATWAYIASASSHSNDEKLFSKIISELNDLQRKIAEGEAEKWLQENTILYEETSWVFPADNNPRFLFKTKDYLYEPVSVKHRNYNGRTTTTITKPRVRYTPFSEEELELFALALKKANGGDNDAKLELAGYYLEQIGVTYDEELAIKWTKDAADNNHSEAQYRYARFLTDRSRYRPKKENPDEAEIIKYLTLAAEQNHLEAQAILGSKYYSGDAIQLDYEKSLKWLTIAAERGNVIAQRYLYRQYFFGYGVNKNFVEAYKWAIIARQDADVLKNDYIIEMEKQLSDDQLDEAEKNIDEWLEKHGKKSESCMDKFLEVLT